MDQIRTELRRVGAFDKTTVTEDKGGEFLLNPDGTFRLDKGGGLMIKPAGFILGLGSKRTKPIAREELLKRLRRLPDGAGFEAVWQEFHDG